MLLSAELEDTGCLPTAFAAIALGQHRNGLDSSIIGAQSHASPTVSLRSANALAKHQQQIGMLPDLTLLPQKRYSSVDPTPGDKRFSSAARMDDAAAADGQPSANHRDGAESADSDYGWLVAAAEERAAEETPVKPPRHSKDALGDEPLSSALTTPAPEELYYELPSPYRGIGGGGSGSVTLPVPSSVVRAATAGAAMRASERPPQVGSSVPRLSSTLFEPLRVSSMRR